MRLASSCTCSGVGCVPARGDIDGELIDGSAEVVQGKVLVEDVVVEVGGFG
jgi:hypothetical protein